MKLSELKNKLNNKQLSLDEAKRRISSVKKEFRVNKNINNINGINNIQNNVKEKKDVTCYNKVSNISSLNEINKQVVNSENTSSLDNVKVIGVTGSKGKSTVCYLVHEYLKLKGKKSILYSSVEVDSPNSVKSRVPMEVALQSENTILDILEEAESYNSDYVVLEVNDSAIDKGLVKDIDFSVRALTNIIPDCNLERYDEDYHVNLKKSFFSNINESSCKCVIGLTGYFKREDFNDFINLNNLDKVTFASKTKCEEKNADYTNIDVLHYNEEDSLDGLKFNLRVKDNIYSFNSNMLLPHSITNIACVVSILEALGEFDSETFRKFLLNVTIPGREEVIKVNGRTIIIGVYLVPMLSVLKGYRIKGNCDCVKVVCGMPGVGFKTWSKHLSDKRRLDILDYIHRDAMTCVKKNADYIYITSNDPAASNPMEICLNLQRHINSSIPSVIETDRKKAIKNAIYESNPNDVIYIAGRGNRKLYCATIDKMEIFTDKEIVMEAIKELGW